MFFVFFLSLLCNDLLALTASAALTLAHNHAFEDQLHTHTHLQNAKQTEMENNDVAGS